MRQIIPLFAFVFLALVSCNKDDDCQGEKKEDTGCFYIYEPVCGCNGVTYSNACHAEVDGVKRWTDGECD